MASCPLLAPLLILSALFFSSFSRDDRCLWRFEDCNLFGERSECVVRLRLLGNGSCDANSSLEVNTTRARALDSSVDERCNLTSCAVLPQKCQWAPWIVYFDTCMLKMRWRSRERCCHPVFRTPINTSDYPALESKCDLEAERQDRSKIRFSSDCIILPKDPPRDKEPSSSDKGPMGFNFALIIIFVFVSLFTLFCSYLLKSGYFRKEPRTTTSLALRKTSVDNRKASQPKTVLVPQPGWPLSEAQPLAK